MPDNPVDILCDAEEALGAVTDLLCCITQEDLHCLSPQRLYSLLELVRVRLSAARKGLSPPAHA